MENKMRFSKKIIICFFLFFYIQCNGPSASRSALEYFLMNNVLTGETPTAIYTVGGTVSGLTGIGLTLQNNSKDDLNIIQNGDFVFNTKLSKEETYLVSIKSQPLAQTCIISGESGKITDDVTSVILTCSSNSGTTPNSPSSPPSTLTYTGNPFTYTQNIPIATNTPTFTGTVTTCSANPSLPTGLTIDNTTCTITGTPTVSQIATNYTITAANTFGNTTATISITINNTAPSALTYTGNPFVYTPTGAIVPITPTVTGSITSCSISPTLPAGLTINSTNCVISGTPTAISPSTSYTITASNSIGSTTAVINITVNTSPPSGLIYAGSPYTYTQGLAIVTNTPTVSEVVTNCSANPSLPAGLSISSTTCAISGTPTGTQAVTTHTITASNLSGSTTANISITVQDLCIFYGGIGTPANCFIGGQFSGTPLTFTGNVTTPYGPSQADGWTAGTTNGVGTAATFYYPWGINTDGTSLYVSDYIYCLIRKIDLATATVTTIGGAASSCISTDGIGTATARFNDPAGITNDGKNLYIADWTGNKIRKMDLTTSTVTTIAGSGTSGATNGIGAAARFSAPFGITYHAGNLYVGDEGNNLIRKIVISTGAVTTLAGSGVQGLINGTGIAARFKKPEGMATDGTNLYVADAGNMVIRKIVIATAEVTTFAGSGEQNWLDGPLLSASFDQPQGVISDGTRLYVADTFNNATLSSRTGL